MKKAFERLELHDMKVSRAVLRGLEDSNVLWLPDLAQEHESLRLRIPGLKRRYRCRTPAMAAGITDHLWSVGDLLRRPVLPAGGVC